MTSSMKPHAERKFYHVPNVQQQQQEPNSMDSLQIVQSPKGSTTITTQIVTTTTIGDNSQSSSLGTTGYASGSGSTTKPSKKVKSKYYLQRRNIRGLIEMVEQNLFGRETVFQGPFGPRRNVYIDQTASGQSLRCIEDYISQHVLPYYANVHSTLTNTSTQTTMFRHEARDIIRNSVGASEHDAVIFCGSGATGPVHKLVQNVTSDREKPPPIVFVGPFEHHSNLLPWRDAGSKMIYIPQTSDGEMDIAFLEERLKEAKEENQNRTLIGSFSVASNVTGIVSDDIAITILMHKYGGLAFWDYSAAAPHIQIVMNPVVLNGNEEGLAKKDALFFSGHKFIGGPQTPGVLVAKKSIFESHVPNGGGGGTVFFVTSDSHRYLKNPEYREEGGTPGIIESIRLGLVFRLKDSIGAKNIISREELLARKIIASWSDCEEIKLLGSFSQPKLPVISFLIDHPESGYYLHYNFVVGLLNDLFGIQTRGGCACAGPYSQSLLGIGHNLAATYESVLLEDSRLDRDHLRRQEEHSSYEIFRPGFIRLSIPFYSSIQEVEFISEAVKLVAQHGWKMLPLYMCNPETGEFHHHLNHMLHHRRWLSWATFDSDGIKSKERTRNNSEDYPNYEECLEQARNILSNAENLCRRRNLPNQSLIFDSEVAHLRWFLLPSESLSILNGTWNEPIIQKPFTVKEFPKGEIVLDYYDSSVPSQIGQAAINKVEDIKGRRVTADSDSFGSSEFSFNDSDYEHLVPGETVTGPSICFSRASVDFETTPEPEPLPTQMNETSPIDVLNNNHPTPEKVDTNHVIGNQMPVASHIIEPFNNLVTCCQKVETLGQLETALEQTTHKNQSNNSVTTNTTSQPLNVQVTANQYIGSHNGNSYEDPLYGNEVSPSSPFVANQFINQNGVHAGMHNLNIGNYSSNTMPSYSSSPLYNCYSPNNSCSPDISAGFQNYQYQNNFVEHNGNDQIFYSELPVQTQTPGYYISNPNMQQYAYPPKYLQQPLEMQIPTQLYQQSPQNSFCASSMDSQSQISSIDDRSSQETLQRSNSTDDYQDVFNRTLRHATSIANELKSEIREVISQVEQGIDPDGIRDRSSSCNRKDTALDQLKRTRTLSGHLLNYKLTRSESEASHTESTSTQTTDTSSDLTDIATEKQSLASNLVCPVKAVNKITKKVSKENHKLNWHCPPKEIFKPTLLAVREFSMIKDGDRILVCLSGGKDSLSLLHTMKQLQYVMKKEGIAFTFGAVTVDPGSTSYNPKPLIPYLKALDVPYFFEEQGIMPTALEKGPECVTSICSFCSRLKRGRIYSSARSNNYNVLAFGQHLDDLAESFFMSVMHNGLLRSMKASYVVKEGDLRVIRPFVNVREKSLRNFAESRGLPVIAENCPACFDTPTERYRVKQLLAQQEILFPKVFVSLRSAIHPLISINRTGMESNHPERKRRGGRKNSVIQTKDNNDSSSE